MDPKWNGAISMDKDGGDWVLMLWAAWGKEKTVNYLKHLAKNNIVFGEGATARTQMLAAGAFKIDLRLNLHRILEYQKKGAPLDWVRMDPILSTAQAHCLSPSMLRIRTRLCFLAIGLLPWKGSRHTTRLPENLSRSSKVKSNLSEALKGLKISVLPAELTVHGNEAGSRMARYFLEIIRQAETPHT